MLGTSQFIVHNSTTKTYPGRTTIVQQCKDQLLLDKGAGIHKRSQSWPISQFFSSFRPLSITHDLKLPKLSQAFDTLAKAISNSQRKCWHLSS